MLTSSERREMIAKIRQLPAKLEAAVKGLNDQQLNTPYGEGKWTPRQVVHHLADSHINAFVRIKLVLTEEKPTVKTYDQEKWAKTVDAADEQLASSIRSRSYVSSPDLPDSYRHTSHVKALLTIVVCNQKACARFWHTLS